MPKQAITLIKGDNISYPLEVDYRDALPVNMYAVQKPILGAAGYMKTWPGLTQFATSLAKEDRGAIYNERQRTHFRLSGNKFVEITPNGSVLELGEIPGLDQCSMPYSFNTQAIIVSGRMFLYSPGIGFQEVTDPDLGNPIDAVWVDGYYFLTDGEYVYHTDINNESSIDPLKFATAEFMPDPSLGVAKTQDNKVLVFGRYSLEYFVNAATTNFAFKRIETRAQKIGIVATHAKCEARGIYFITGGYRDSDLGVYMVQVGKASKMSTREIDKLLNQYSESELANMRMESRTEHGSTFVIVHLPKETLCCNLTIAEKIGKENAWSFLTTGVNNEKYRAINGIFDARIGKWLYGDKFSNNVAYLNENSSAQYDEASEYVLYSPLLNLATASINEIEIETIPGHTQITDASVGVSLTYDGLVYGNEYHEMYGEPKDYEKRFIVRRLGYIRDWVGFKFRGVSQSPASYALMTMDYS